MDSTENLKKFSDMFWKGFERPQLKTKKFKKVWLDMEGWRDSLAGPLYSINEYENCDYVFNNQNEIFKEINSCEELLDWCMKIVKEYRHGVCRIQANTKDEMQDQTLLLNQTVIMEKLSNLAIDIQRRRIREI